MLLLAVLWLMEVVEGRISYQCGLGQVLVVHETGEDFIKMHCGRPQLCGQTPSCDYSGESQSFCTGILNFASRVDQPGKMDNVRHKCCRYSDQPNRSQSFGIQETGCFAHRLTEDKKGGMAKYGRVRVKRWNNFRLNLFRLRSRSPPNMVVKAIVRTMFGYNVVICRMTCALEERWSPATTPSPIIWPAQRQTTRSSTSWTTWTATEIPSWTANRTRSFTLTSTLTSTLPTTSRRTSAHTSPRLITATERTPGIQLITGTPLVIRTQPPTLPTRLPVLQTTRSRPLTPVASPIPAGGQMPSVRPPDAPGFVQEIISTNTEAAPTNPSAANPSGFDAPNIQQQQAAVAALQQQLNCFSADMLLDSPQGPLRMDRVRIGDMVLVSDEDGGTTYEPVEAFYHRDHNSSALFLLLSTSSSSIRLTLHHLLPVLPGCRVEEEVDYVFAERARVGDCVLTRSPEDRMVLDPVRRISGPHSLTGFYAPVTSSGNLIVNGVQASCFAEFESQDLQSALFLLLRFLWALSDALSHLLFGDVLSSQASTGEVKDIPASLQLFRSVAQALFPDKFPSVIP